MIFNTCPICKYGLPRPDYKHTIEECRIRTKARIIELREQLVSLEDEVEAKERAITHALKTLEQIARMEEGGVGAFDELPA